MRSNTHAYLTMADDIPESVKKERLAEIRGVAENLKREYLSASIGKQQFFMPGKVNCRNSQDFTDLFNRTYILPAEQQCLSNVMIEGVMTTDGKLLRV